MRGNGLFIIGLIFLLGCGNSNQNHQPNKNSKTQEIKASSPVQNTSKVIVPGTANVELAQAKQFHPFYIFADKGSRQNHYVPSGFMPDGKCVYFNDSWVENCVSGNSCVRVEYDVECSRDNQKWAGIYWLNPPNNWGKRKGGFNLSGAERLTFWAKGEKGGEQIQEFTVGGINGDYPDSDMVVLGPVILTSEWKQYTIDLRGKDLSYISGGFAWTTNEEVNPNSCVFYLDDIRFE